jgi:hypothetical protein
MDGEKKSELGGIWLPPLSLAVVLGLGTVVVWSGFDPANHAGRAIATGIVALTAATAFALTGARAGLLNFNRWRHPRPTPSGDSR